MGPEQPSFERSEEPILNRTPDDLRAPEIAFPDLQRLKEELSGGEPLPDGDYPTPERKKD